MLLCMVSLLFIYLSSPVALEEFSSIRGSLWHGEANLAHGSTKANPALSVGYQP